MSSYAVLAIPFHGPLDGKDLDGEYFDARTDTGLSAASVLPVLWHHGKDEVMRRAPIGIARDWWKSDIGWLTTVELDERGVTHAMVDQLSTMCDIFASTGAIASSVQRGADGHLARWIVDELSFSTSPQNPFAVVTKRKDFVA
jgi:hypothetical protein